MMTKLHPKDKPVSSRIIRTVFLTGAILMVAACGIKPSQLDPPGGEHAPAYPATYPKE